MRTGAGFLDSKKHLTDVGSRYIYIPLITEKRPETDVFPIVSSMAEASRGDFGGENF